MKTTINLTKIYFRNTISNLMYSKKKLNRSLFSIIVLFAFIAVCIGFSFYTIAEPLSKTGNTNIVLLFAFILATIMVIMITMFDSQTYFYNNKDYDMLASLPIKPINIITAKYLNSYLISLLYNCAIIIPAFVVYFIFSHITIIGFTLFALALVLMPAYTQLFGSILAWIINAVTSKMKNKSIIKSIFSILLLVVYLTLIYSMNSNTIIEIFSGGMPMFLKVICPHIYFLNQALIENSFLYAFYFILISVAFALISIFIVSIGYKSINSSIKTIRKKITKKKELNFKQSYIIKSLIKKETKTFFMTPIYFINGMTGPILMIVMLVSMLLNIKSFASYVSIDISVLILALMLVLCLGIAPPTSVSISMEGSKLYKIKSLPISFKTISIAKILFNLILYLPFLLVGMIGILIFTNINIATISCIFVYAMLTTFIFILVGLLLNLRYAKLNWDNEYQAVKQGMSTLFTMLIDILLSAIPLIFYFVFNISALICLIISITLSIIILISIFIILFSSGKKLFERL